MKIPRGADGVVTHYVEGMGDCFCKKEGLSDGKHLIPDCPFKAQMAKLKAERVATQKINVAPMLDPEDAPADCEVGLSEAALAFELNTFFDNNESGEFKIPTSFHSSNVAIHIDESNFDALAELQAQGIDVASINYSTSGPTADSGSDLPNFMLDMQRWAHEYGFNQTSVHILGSYSSNDGVGYWSIGSVPHAGIYFADHTDVAKYYHGCKAFGSITTCKKFDRESDALSHFRKNTGLDVPGYTLSDTRPTSGVPVGTPAPVPPPVLPTDSTMDAGGHSASAPTVDLGPGPYRPISPPEIEIEISPAEIKTPRPISPPEIEIEISPAETKTSPSPEPKLERPPPAPPPPETSPEPKPEQPPPVPPPPETEPRPLTTPPQTYLERNHFMIFAGTVTVLVLIIGILIGVLAAGVAAPVHYRYIGPGGNLVANGGGVLDGHADHRALTIYSSKVAEINIAHAHEINWNKTKPFLIGWSVISILLGLYLSWPIWGLYVAALAPRDFFQVWTYITLVPILSLFPTLMPRVTQACDRLGFRRPMDSIVSAFNRLRHALPEVTKLAIVISAICFGQSHLPHGASTTTYGNSDAQNLSKFSPSLSADASNSGSFLSSLPEPINALTLPYVGEWHAATRSFDAEPGALNLPLTSTISQQALANVTIKAVEKSFDTKLPLIAASPDSGATASITADCNNLESTRKCDEVFGAANGAITRCTCIGDMPIITRTTSGDLVRFKFTNVRCVPGFRYTLLSVTQIWNEQKIDARFCDLNHLQLPQSAGGHTVPYDRSLTLSTLILVSEARLDRKHMIAKSRADHQHLAGPGWKANIYPGDVGHLNQHHALLCFHSVTSSAHLGKLSKAQIS